MKFIIERNKIVTSLGQVINIISNRPILPILSNFLIKVNKNTLFLIANNLEIEIMITIKLFQEYLSGSITIPAKKFFNICRCFPSTAKILIQLKEKKIFISSENTKFSLSTISPKEFPNIKKIKSEINFSIKEKKIKFLIEKTYFSIANQDVRYYLNGLLIEINKNKITAISTDGYRLSSCFIYLDNKLPQYSVIIPRKSVLELIRLLNYKDDEILININSTNISIQNNIFLLTSKLIDGSFPNYNKIIKDESNRSIIINCDVLKKALSRSLILSSEKIHGVRFLFKNNYLKIISYNTEQEKSEEKINILYDNEEVELCFNAHYILDVLNTLKCHDIRWLIKDSKSSIRIEDVKDNSMFYIIMPMRL